MGRRVSVLRTSPLSSRVGSRDREEGVPGSSAPSPRPPGPPLHLPGLSRRSAEASQGSVLTTRCARGLQATLPCAHLGAVAQTCPVTVQARCGTALCQGQSSRVCRAPAPGLGCPRVNPPPLSFRTAGGLCGQPATGPAPPACFCGSDFAATIWLFLDTLHPVLTAAPGPGAYTHGPCTGLALRGPPPPGRPAPGSPLGSLVRSRRDWARQAQQWFSAPGPLKSRPQLVVGEGVLGAKNRKLGHRGLNTGVDSPEPGA